MIRTALEDAALLPAAVRGLEMHGTGTPLGDPIEVGAAAEVLAAARPGGESCYEMVLTGVQMHVS